jgi:hypothetical protein
MFSKIYNGNIKPDMYLLDGRLQPEDIKIISDLQIENSLILLDDFEGTEKGVVNTFVLTENFKNNFIVAYFAATQVPLLPPLFSKSFTSPITMPRSTALHIS